jgi:hypothetical protein
MLLLEAKPAPRGAAADRASSRATGRELGVAHSPPGKRTRQWGRARPRGVSTPGRRGGSPANQGRTPVKEWILDTRGQPQDGDARNVINTRRAANTEARAAAGYRPLRGGRYDSREDRSLTPEPPGTQVFRREIRTASFPQRFR